jgi:hypothetical protein
MPTVVAQLRQDMHECAVELRKLAYTMPNGVGEHDLLQLSEQMITASGQVPTIATRTCREHPDDDPPVQVVRLLQGPQRNRSPAHPKIRNSLSNAPNSPASVQCCPPKKVRAPSRRRRSAQPGSQTQITALGCAERAVIREPVTSRVGHDVCQASFARLDWRFCFSTSANSSTWSACARLLAASLRFA